MSGNFRKSRNFYKLFYFSEFILFFGDFVYQLNLTGITLSTTINLQNFRLHSRYLWDHIQADQEIFRFSLKIFSWLCEELNNFF